MGPEQSVCLCFLVAGPGDPGLNSTGSSFRSIRHPPSGRAASQVRTPSGLTRTPRHCGNERIPAARTVQSTTGRCSIHLPPQAIACATFSGHSSWCKPQLQLIHHRKAGLSRRRDLIVAFRVITPENAADGIYERHKRSAAKCIHSSAHTTRRAERQERGRAELSLGFILWRKLRRARSFRCRLRVLAACWREPLQQHGPFRSFEALWTRWLPA
jgi:hypothetical protein